MEENDIIYGTLSPENDDDYIALELTAGETYMFNYTGTEFNDIAAVLYLEGQYQVIEYVDNQFSYTAVEDGTYYLRIHDGIGDYAVTYYQIGDEPNNLPDYPDEPHDGIDMTVGTTLNGIIAQEGDIDQIGIELNANQTYLITVSSDNFPVQINEITDQNGDINYVNDDQFIITPDASETYYIAIASENNFGGLYEVSATNQGSLFTNSNDTFIFDYKVFGDIDMMAGDDTMVITNATNYGSIIDGNSGNDTLKMDHTVNEFYGIDFFKNFEIIDLEDNQTDFLSLSLDEVIDVTDGNNILRVDGDSNDYVDIFGEWVQGADQNIDGEIYNVYTSGSATLLIDEDIEQSFY